LETDIAVDADTLASSHARRIDVAVSINRNTQSTELLNGTWKLRVNDNAAGDVGYINSWNVTF
jgi:subtilisin-like proprotein convertase family protein